MTTERLTQSHPVPYGPVAHEKERDVHTGADDARERQEQRSLGPYLYRTGCRGVKKGVLPIHEGQVALGLCDGFDRGQLVIELNGVVDCTELRVLKLL